jgi:hypothetical protein
MRTLLLRAAFSALALWLVTLVTASATVTGEFRVAIDPGQRAEFSFVPSSTGHIIVDAVFKPIGAKLLVTLQRPGLAEPVARVEGENPLQLVIELDGAQVGLVWRAAIENLSDRTISGVVEITYPKALCKELSAEFSLDLRYVHEFVPMREEQCGVMHRVLRSLPEGLRRGLERIVAFPQDPEVAGQYLRNTIRIFGDLQDARLARVFFHEVGHHIQFAHFTEARQALWTELNQRSGEDRDNYARLYGRTNQFEDFATMFEAYTDSTEKILQTAQATHARGKPILLEKVRFVAELFRHERAGSARTFIYKTESLFGEVKILRASVLLESNGLPQIPQAPDWEEF